MLYSVSRFEVLTYLSCNALLPAEKQKCTEVCSGQCLHICTGKHPMPQCQQISMWQASMQQYACGLHKAQGAPALSVCFYDLCLLAHAKRAYGLVYMPPLCMLS